MNLLKFSKGHSRFLYSSGLWFRLRYAYPSPKKIFSALFCPPGKIKKIDAKAKVVIVGLGVAAYTFASRLKRTGFQNVVFVAKNRDFGGKCVNYGCMPAEYALTLEKVPLGMRRGYLHKFRVELASQVGGQIGLLGYPVIEDVVLGVDDKKVLLENNQPLSFDYLVLATGNNYPKPDRVPLNTSKEILIEDLWEIDPGKNLIIYAKDNIAAISMAQSVQTLGLRVTVLLAGKNPFKKLPSYEFYLRIVKSSGAQVFEGIRLFRVDEKGVSFECGSAVQTLEYDHFLVASKPEVNLPLVDKKFPQLDDVDLTTGAMYSRSDIYISGDSAGCITAAEAEYQALMLGDYFSYGKKIDLESLSKIPLIFSGHCPLAIIGDPWTLNESPGAWRELDFSHIGYTKLSGQYGRLWYLLDKYSNKLSAIHICHPCAHDLIACAALLLNFPVSDPIWLNVSTHPSAMEIFKVIAINESRSGK